MNISEGGSNGVVLLMGLERRLCCRAVLIMGSEGGVYGADLVRDSEGGL